MSYLAQTLVRILEKRKLKQSDLEKISGLDKAKISRWISGQQGSIKPKDLEKLTSAISDDPRDRAEVIASRLRDLCHGPGSELINITIGSEPYLHEQPAPFGNPLPPKLEEAFVTLRAWAAEDKEIRDLLISLANLKRTGRF